MEIIVEDPLGDQIILPDTLCPNWDVAEEVNIYNTIREVIEKPAFIIQPQNENIRYYYRAIGWHFTVLISVAQNGRGWIAEHCQLNPQDQLLTSIIAKGQKIF